MSTDTSQSSVSQYVGWYVDRYIGWGMHKIHMIPQSYEMIHYENTGTFINPDGPNFL